MQRRVWYSLIVMVTLFLLVVGCSPAATPTTAPKPTDAPKAAATVAPTATLSGDALILATTTSTQDSGLLPVVLPDFEKQFNVKVQVIAVGTGQAMKLGEDGNADVLLVHDRAREDAFMQAKHGTRREDVMYNDYIILGPKADPAGIKGAKVAVDALKKIAEAKAPFVSRGDDSGTHSKEKAIWKAASIEPKGDWYISAGQGMGAVLTMAEEKQACTLSDRATYLARTAKGIKLDILVEGDSILFNPYGVITVNPAKSPKIKAELATKFVDWIISVPTQEKIQAYGLPGINAPLFFADSGPWKAAKGKGAGAAPATGGKGLKVSGMVNKELALTDAEVKVMGTMETESTNKSGEKTKYTGVALSALLEKAGVKDGAKKVVFVADDGFTGEAEYAQVKACASEGSDDVRPQSVKLAQ